MAAQHGTALLLCLSTLEPLALAFTHPEAREVGGKIKSAASPLALTHWTTLILSRGIYTVLAFLIILCVICTVLKNKFGQQKSSRSNLSSESSKWLEALWKTTGCSQVAGCSNVALRRYSLSGLVGGHGTEGDPDLSLEQTLRTFENEVSALRGELEISNKSRLELESSLELLDRDKMSAEEALASERVTGLMELEKLKEEHKNTQRELQRIMSEKADLSREVESLNREARIAAAALRDQVSLQGRLEDARMEIEKLRDQMDSLQKEKEAAVNTVRDIMVKAGRRSLSLPLSAPLPDSVSHFQDPDILMMVGGAVGDTLTIANEELEDPEMLEEALLDDRSSDGRSAPEYILRRRKEESEESDSDSEACSPFDGGGDENRPLMNSTVFRKFMQVNFPAKSNVN